MARKPENHVWVGFTAEQQEILDTVDLIGNNGWSRNGQTDSMMPALLRESEGAGLTIQEVVDAMQSIGYDKRATHELVRWERKRRTGKFGR